MTTTTVDKPIPISQLAQLAKLAPVEQAEGLLRAEQIAQSEGKKRNATHIAQAVREIKQLSFKVVEEAQTQIIPNQQEQPESAPTTVEAELEHRPIVPDPSDICTTLMSNIPVFEDAQLQQLIKEEF